MDMLALQLHELFVVEHGTRSMLLPRFTDTLKGVDEVQRGRSVLLESNIHTS